MFFFSPDFPLVRVYLFSPPIYSPSDGSLSSGLQRFSPFFSLLFDRHFYFFHSVRMLYHMSLSSLSWLRFFFALLILVCFSSHCCAYCGYFVVVFSFFFLLITFSCYYHIYGFLAGECVLWFMYIFPYLFCLLFFFFPISPVRERRCFLGLSLSLALSLLLYISVFLSSHSFFSFSGRALLPPSLYLSLSLSLFSLLYFF